MKLKIVIAIFLVIGLSECSRILITYPTVSKSHLIPLQTLAKTLAQKGHEITFVSPFPLDKKIKNYRDIKVPFDEADKAFIGEMARNPKGQSMLKTIPKMSHLMYKLGNDTLQMKEMRDLMQNEKFDVVIVGFFMTEFMLGLADHFKCPSIMFSPAGSFNILHQMVGNPTEPAAASHVMLALTKMDFVGRVKNFIVTGMEMMATEFFKYKARQVYNYNFPSDRYISYEESFRNVSLVLLNTHFSNGFVRPYLPNVIEVGGLQVKPTPSKLPENLQTFLDGAADGAILFSFGSNAKSTYLSKKTITTLLNVFAKLKQKVIMKWEDDAMDGKPENVLISKWLPQDDVLAHKNMKIFISHCGLGSVIESKYHGVPIIGMPIFADQPSNAESVVKEGWGLKVELDTLTEKSLMDAVQEILSSSKFSKAAKRLSDLARDRPMNAQDTATYWIEYVIRHHGAPHLHYPGADLNFSQNNSLDVIFFLFAVLYVLIKTFIFIIKLVCCRKQKKKDLKKKNK